MVSSPSIVDGTEEVRVEPWDSSFRVVGWLEDGSLVAHQPYVVPSKLERYDPRTEKVSPFRTISPIDPRGCRPSSVRASAGWTDDSPSSSAG
jgi:hypothetical protein